MMCSTHRPTGQPTRVSNARRSTRSLSHVVVLFKCPRFAAVMRLLSLPVKGRRRDVHERPADRQAVCIDAAQHNAIALATALRYDDIAGLWIDEHNAPLFELRVEKSKRSPDRALFLRPRRIPNPQVLHGVAIHHPPELQLSLFARHRAA